jgi:hypothetical protein
MAGFNTSRPLITDRLPLAQAEAGFRAWAEKNATKVTLLPEVSWKYRLIFREYHRKGGKDESFG